MRLQLQHQAWIVLAAAVMFFTGLGASRLWDDDEPKNATCAREMWQRGDPVVPTFNGQLRTDKPALLYWLMMGSYSLFGVNEFAARCPSAVLAVGTSLLTYHLGRLLFRPQVGLWAALIVTSNVLFCVAARAATPDSTLVFTTTLALVAYVWSMAAGRDGGFSRRFRRLSPFSALSEKNGAVPLSVVATSGAMPKSRWAFIAIYAAMGLAVLAKGPIGAIAPLACFGLFSLLACPGAIASVGPPDQGTLLNYIARGVVLFARRIEQMFYDLPRATLAMRPALLFLVILAVAMPWYLWVGLRTDGQWLQGFFWRHNIERFTTPLEGHRGSILFHFYTLAGCFFPWCMLLPAGAALFIRRIRTADPQRQSYLLALVWAGLWLAIFSLAGTKLPNYVLPAYPALALLPAVWVADWINRPARKLAFHGLSAGWCGLAVLGIAITVGVTVAGRRWLPDDANFGWIGILPVIGAGLGYYFHRGRRPGAAFGTLVVTTISMLLAVFTIVAPPLSERQNGPGLAEVLRRFDGRPTEIGKFQIRPPGVVFYSETTIDDLKNPSDVQQFFGRSDRAILLTDERGYDAVKSLLPPDATIVARRRQFPERLGEMLVIARGAGANSDLPPSVSLPGDRSDVSNSVAGRDRLRR